MACSNCARATPMSVACARVVSSCVRACATSTARGDPLVVTVDGQLQRLLVGGDGRVQQLPLGIEPAELEVVDRQLRLHAERHRLEIRGARLRDRAVRLHVAPDAAPHVRLVREINRQLIVERGASGRQSRRERTGSPTRARRSPTRPR